MQEGRLARCLGCAAGEVVLVVVCILIALQINAWAEARRDRAFERTTLVQIGRNLQTVQAKLKSMLVNRRLAVEAIDHMTAHRRTDQDSASCGRGSCRARIPAFSFTRRT